MDWILLALFLSPAILWLVVMVGVWMTWKDTSWSASYSPASSDDDYAAAVCCTSVAIMAACS